MAKHFWPKPIPIDPKSPIIEVVQKPSLVPSGNVLIVKPDGTKVSKKISGKKPDVVVNVQTSDSTDVTVLVNKTDPLFPDFRKKSVDVSVLGDSTKVGVAYQSKPIIRFKPDLEVGVSATTNNIYLSVATMALKVGPFYTGPSLNVNQKEIRVGVDVGVKLKESVMIGGSVNPFDVENPGVFVRIKF